MFASLTPEFIELLRNKVELVRYSKGDVICRQGDIADSFYLVRIGFVKVSEAHPGGELVLAYLAAADISAKSGCSAKARRTATCTALDHVELVRITRRRFPPDGAAVPGHSARIWNAGAASARSRTGNA